MTRRLIIMRHAKSDWANHSLSDHDRPLNERGRRTAPLMGKHFFDNNLLPSVIVASTATRVRETLGLMLAEWQIEPIVRFEESLYLASAGTLSDHVSRLNDSWSDAMLVGHNPGLTDFVSRLANQPLEMPTAGVAIFESAAESWPDAVAIKNWRLEFLWRPRDLFE